MAKGEVGHARAGVVGCQCDSESQLSARSTIYTREHLCWVETSSSSMKVGRGEYSISLHLVVLVSCAYFCMSTMYYKYHVSGI